MMAARRIVRALVMAGVFAGLVSAASGCGLDRAVDPGATGAVIFDRPDHGPAREGAGVRLARLGRRLLDLARTSQQPVPLLFPELHAHHTLIGTD